MYVENTKGKSTKRYRRQAAWGFNARWIGLMRIITNAQPKNLLPQALPSPQEAYYNG